MPRKSKSMKLKTISLSITLFSTLIGGCATLSEPECRNADWYMIGIEDGMNGRLSSRIGEHRKACSQYNITPNINAYQNGHADGVIQFCTEAKGFATGKEGQTYNGVCPSGLEDTFLKGYRIGKDFHALSYEIEQSTIAIDSFEKQIEELEKDISEKEKHLVNGKTTKTERKHLLEKIKEKQKELGELETKTLDLEKNRAVMENEYSRLQSLYKY